MLSPTLSASVLFLASSHLVNAAGYATREPQLPSCQGFDVLTNETRPLESRNLTISAGVVCNVPNSNFSTPCDVLSGGWPTLQNAVLFTNGSAVRDNYAVVYGLWNVTGDSNALYGGNIVAIENQTVTFENGTAGDVIFIPTYRCVTGHVQGCPANISIADGTEVSACYPELTDRVVSFESVAGHFENISVVAGSRSINETTPQAAANLKQNPNNRPPYGLTSSGAFAGPRLAGAGVTGALIAGVVWFGVWTM